MRKISFFKWLLVLAILYFLAKTFFWGSGSFYSRYVSSQKLKVVQEEKKQLEEENKKLQEKLETVENDAGQLEKVAREEYGMQKEGEVIIKFVQEDD